MEIRQRSVQHKTCRYPENLIRMILFVLLEWSTGVTDAVGYGTVL